MSCLTIVEQNLELGLSLSGLNLSLRIDDCPPEGQGTPAFLLLESGSYLLQENGGKIIWN